MKKLQAFLDRGKPDWLREQDWTLYRHHVGGGQQGGWGWVSAAKLARQFELDPAEVRASLERTGLVFWHLYDGQPHDVLRLVYQGALSRRVYFALLRHSKYRGGRAEIEKLLTLTDEELLAIPLFGKKALRELRAAVPYREVEMRE